MTKFAVVFSCGMGAEFPAQSRKEALARAARIAHKNGVKVESIAELIPEATA